MAHNRKKYGALKESTVVLQKSMYGRSRNLGERCFECFCIQPWRATPCHIYSDSMPSKQIIGKTVTNNWTTNSFKVESWQHTTLRIASCYLSMCSLQCIYYIHIVTTFQWSITHSSLPSAWGCASKTPWVHHTKLAPEWGAPLNKIWPWKWGQK